MKALRTVLFVNLSLIWLGCSNNPTSPGNLGKVTVEGTVQYFVGGGTVEMPYPPGFILVDVRWITAPVCGGGFYLAGKVDSSFIGKSVRATGKLDTVSLTGSPPSYKYGYITMIVDTLEIIN